jgi:mitochondrial fission protein ELM1
MASETPAAPPSLDRPLRVWCATDGRIGIELQALAVADALAALVPVERRVLRLTPSETQTWLPPPLWPAPLRALPQAERAQFAPPWPDVWIGNGRRTIPYSIGMRRWSRGATLTVQLQMRATPPRLVDIAAPPVHDGVTGPNVVATFGAPVWHPSERIAAARLAHPMPPNPEGLNVLVVLGGTSPRHRFTDAVAARLCDRLAALAATGARLWITASRRTPEAISARMRALAARVGGRFFESEAKDGPNPYIGWLAQADVALVTEDSANMMTDATYFGLPLHLIALEGHAGRLSLYHRALIAHGAARWFEGAVARWTYPPTPNAMVLATAIRDAAIGRIEAR